MTRPQMDIPLARKVLEFARQEHEGFTFDMGPWYCKYKDCTTDLQADLGVTGKCGTVACLSGTAFFLAPNADVVEDPDAMGYTPYIDGEPSDWVDGGAQLLGLDHDVAWSLFFTSDNDAALGQLEVLIEEAERDQACH